MVGCAKNSRTRRGFSLIELLVVVALLGLLAAAVFVGVSGMLPSERMESAARRLGAAVANLRAEAAIRREPHGIVYDLENGTYTFLAPPITEGDQPPEPYELEDLEELKPTSLGRGVVFEDVAFGGRKVFRGRVKIYFGTVQPAPPHLVHLKGVGDLRYTVEVNTMTGLVDVYDDYRDFDVLLTEEKFNRR